MRTRPLTLVVCLLLAGGCQQGPPPEPPVPPPAEDLSHWTVPTLVQPEARKPFAAVAKPRPAGRAETVYDYVPGDVYKVTVALDAPLDVILEEGEKVQALIGSDPRPIPQATATPPPASEDPGVQEASQKSEAPTVQVKERWEYREAIHGVGEQASAHILLRALEPGAMLGLTVTTSKRVYYLTCRSVAKSPIRAVRWIYPSDTSTQREQDTTPPSLLPHPDELKFYHVGYEVRSAATAPDWMPRGVWDDGKKMFLLLPVTTLYGTVPLVRAVGANGPMVINTRQYLNVIMIDLLAARLELRVGTGETAEVVTITRGALRTIQCPEDPDCPRWPAAARHLAGR